MDEETNRNEILNERFIFISNHIDFMLLFFFLNIMNVAKIFIGIHSNSLHS